MVGDRLLLGPGPCNPYPEVMQALARPVLGHLDPEFLDLLDETADRLRVAFGTRNRLTLPISGTGSAGMETCFVNLVEPGDAVIVAVNGVFGERMCDVASRAGAQVVRIDVPWGEPVDPERILEAQRANPDAVLAAVVHAETSTGARSDLEPLRALRETETLLLVDSVTGLGGIPLEVDAWGIDACYSGTQKCLGVPPGLAPVTFSARAEERMARRKTPAQSWYLDLQLLAAYIGSQRRYHHTAPISMVYALDAGLGVLLEEGIESVQERHRLVGTMLQDALPELGFSFVVDEPYRLPQLTSAYLPEGVDDAALRKSLLETYGIEVGAGLGDFAGRIVRVGLMGHSARERSVVALLGALREILG